MSVTPAQDGDGFHLVVAEDGSLPAAELARFGLRPGTHLRVVPEQITAKRKSARGLLAGTVAAGGVSTGCRSRRCRTRSTASSWRLRLS